MEKSVKKTARVMTILSSVLLLTIMVSFPARAPSVTQNNILFARMYFVDYPDGTKGIRTTLIFDFNDTTGLPINTNSPALENIQKAEFSATMQFYKWYSSFSVSYDSMSSEMANEYTDELCKDFLKACDLNLSMIDRNYQTNNQTGNIETTRKLEPAPYDIITTEKFLKYKPSTEFGSLITKDFLCKYVPGYTPEGTTRMDISWSLSKNSEKFHWRLMVTATSVDTWLTGDEKDKDIVLDLNELLHNAGTIPLNQSEITVEIENVHDFSGKTYSLDIIDIFPSGYTKETDSRRTTITYGSPISSLQNIKCRMKLNKEANDFNWIPIGIAAVIIAIVILAAIALQKRKGCHTTRLNKKKGKGR